MYFVGFFLALLFVPETKALSLEELDSVFSVPTEKHARYQIRKLGWVIRKYFLCGGSKVKDMEVSCFPEILFSASC